MVVLLGIVLFASMPVHGIESRVYKQYTRMNSMLTTDKVIEVFPHNNDIWIITGGGGVARIDEEGKWTNFKAMPNGIGDNSVNCIAADYEGNIYFGLPIGTSIYKKDHQWERLYMNNNKIYGENVTSIGADTLGGMWYGVTNYGAYYVDAEGKRKYYNPTNSQLPSSDVTKIKLDDQDGVWFAMHPNYSDVGGVAYLDQEGKWTKYNANNSKIPSNRVNDIYIAKDGAVWMGTVNGLARLKDGEWTVYKNKTVMEYNIKAIAEDQSGNIYAATWGDGLIQINTEGELTTYTVRNSRFIPNNYLHHVAIDKEDRIWISSNMGIIEIAKDVSIETTPSIHDKVTVVIGGEPLRFDVDPVIRQGTTLVSMRNFLEALGQNVEWNQEEQKVTSTGTKTIELFIGEKDATVNGEVSQLDVVPEIIQGRTMIPLRWAAESLGYTVEWDSVNYIINVVE